MAKGCTQGGAPECHSKMLVALQKEPYKIHLMVPRWSHRSLHPGPTSMSELHVSPVADVLLQTPLLRGLGAEPLQRQLLQRLRSAIWAGRLPAGCRLPGSRALAVDLAVSRNSVTAVYEQLGAGAR
eukprot:gene43422-53926_t